MSSWVRAALRLSPASRSPRSKAKKNETTNRSARPSGAVRAAFAISVRFDELRPHSSAKDAAEHLSRDRATSTTHAGDAAPLVDCGSAVATPCGRPELEARRPFARPARAAAAGARA